MIRGVPRRMAPMWAKHVTWVVVAAGLVGAAAGGCKKKRAGKVESRRTVADAGPEAAVDPLFPHTAVRRLRAEPPRQDLPLPSTLDELAAMREGDPRFPAAQVVEDLLCLGDAGTRERLGSALARTSAAETARVVGAYADMERYCSDACTWAVAALPAAKAAERQLLYHLISRCPGAEIDTLMAADDVPAVALVRRIMNSDQDPVPFSARLLAATHSLVLANDPSAGDAIRMLAWTLDPRAAAELLALHAQVSDAALRDDLAAELSAFPDHAGARAVNRPFCAAHADDHRCKEPHTRPAPATGEPQRSVADAEACLARGETDSYDLAECLTFLARKDRARAVAAARKLASDPRVKDRLAEVVHALDRFPAEGALRARLAELGLLGSRTPPSDEAPQTTAEWLRATGRSTSFDVETGMFPNQHDSLLRTTLAPLTGDALAGVVFGETPPRDHDGGSYVLQAWMDGWRYSASAENLGDWYDVGAVLGLMNHLLAERGRDLRCLTLPTGDQTTTVACGPAAGLKAALREGLLASDDPDSARAAGKAFEDKVFEQLQKEGGGTIERDVPLGAP